jgi:hypothetical protein
MRRELVTGSRGCCRVRLGTDMALCAHSDGRRRCSRRQEHRDQGGRFLAIASCRESARVASQNPAPGRGQAGMPDPAAILQRGARIPPVRPAASRKPSVLQRQSWRCLSAGAVVGGAGLGLASSAPHYRSGAWSRSGLGGRMRVLNRRRSSGTVSAMSCSVPAPEPLLDQLADDVHAPGAARARPVPLSHPPPAAGGGRRPCSAARHRARRVAAGARPGRPRGGTRPAGGPRRAKRRSRCGRAPCPRLAAGVHHHVAADTRQGPAPAHRGPGGPPGFLRITRATRAVMRRRTSSARTGAGALALVSDTCTVVTAPRSPSIRLGERPS